MLALIWTGCHFYRDPAYIFDFVLIYFWFCLTRGPRAVSPFAQKEVLQVSWSLGEDGHMPIIAL